MKLKNEKLCNQVCSEIQRMRRLSIEEMLKLAWQVLDWRAIRVSPYMRYHYGNDYTPSVSEFQGVVGNIALDLEYGKDGLSRSYEIIVYTHLNTLGRYKEKEGKCFPELIRLYSDLDSEYIQGNLERIRLDMESNLEEARKLIKNK